MFPFYTIPILIIPIINLQRYKDYLIACEYLQIDPRKKYEIEYINERVDYVLSLWNESEDNYKKIRRSLIKFRKEYKWYIGKWYKLPHYMKKYSEKDKFQIFDKTIKEEYEKQELTTINYKSYSKWQNKVFFITLGIMLLVLIPMIILILLFT